MFKFALVVLALLAVASAQLIASPYGYGLSGLYRSGVYSAGYPAVSTYSAGVLPAYPYAGYNGLLYK